MKQGTKNYLGVIAVLGGSMAIGTGVTSTQGGTSTVLAAAAIPPERANIPNWAIIRLRFVLEAMIEILESPLDVQSALIAQGAENEDIALAALLNAEYPENPIDPNLTPAEVDQAILDCTEALDILALDTSFYRSAALYYETIATLEDMLAALEAMN